MLLRSIADGNISVRAAKAPVRDDVRFTSVKARVANSAVLVPILSEIRKAQPSKHCQARFSGYQVMHAVANESLDVLRDPHVEATRWFSYLA